MKIINIGKIKNSTEDQNNHTWQISHLKTSVGILNILNALYAPQKNWENTYILKQFLAWII